MADDEKIHKVMMVHPKVEMAKWEKILWAVLWLELIYRIVMPPGKRRG